MFRLIRLMFPIAFGIYLGVHYERWQMRSECASGAGDWTGTICVGSELLQ